MDQQPLLPRGTTSAHAENTIKAGGIGTIKRNYLRARGEYTEAGELICILCSARFRKPFIRRIHYLQRACNRKKFPSL